LAAQNTIDVGCRASPCTDRVEAVGEQTALGCENSREIDCRQAMPRRQYDDRSTICRCFLMWQDDEASVGLASVYSVSALPPIADIADCDWHVRFVPKADIRPIRSPHRRDP